MPNLRSNHPSLYIAGYCMPNWRCLVLFADSEIETILF